MKVPYAKIIITVNAEQEEIDGPYEIDLSDDIYMLEEDLRSWLERRAANELLNFTFDISGE